MPIWVAALLGGLAALACTVLAFIFITPESKRNTLNNFFVFIHDLFNFKFLIIEKILKALYIFNTLFCIGFGFFGLFSGNRIPTSFFSNESRFESFALPSILILILGPIVVRLVYEAMMMFLLLVKNTTEINNKLGEKSAPAAEKPAAPTVTASVKPEAATAAPAEPQPEYVYCSQCGARCEKGQLFCNQCGKKL